MELVTRILDGSISYSPRGEPRGRSFFGGRISQDDKIDRLEDVGLLAGCSRRQLRAIARISEVIEVPAGSVLARAGTRPRRVLLALMAGTAALSSIMSDVPVCAIFMAVALGIFARAKVAPGSAFGKSVMMGIPIAALIGGVATPAGFVHLPLSPSMVASRDSTSPAWTCR